MNRRWRLSVVWLASFVLAVLLLESYFLRQVTVMGQRVPILTAASRPAMYGELAQIYGPVLLLIGAAWFAKPLKPIPSSTLETQRWRWALACTLGFNAIVLALIGAYHWQAGTGEVLETMRTAKGVGVALAVLVAWPNVHYFGAKPPG